MNMTDKSLTFNVVNTDYKKKLWLPIKYNEKYYLRSS